VATQQAFKPDAAIAVVVNADMLKPPPGALHILTVQSAL
jgi:hypothetical protein